MSFDKLLSLDAEFMAIFAPAKMQKTSDLYASTHAEKIALNAKPAKPDQGLAAFWSVKIQCV